MARSSRDAPGRPRRLVVGVISDTHGLLRPEAVDALAGVDVIVHAGDVGSHAVLVGLRRIAPVLAVRGNNDREAWAAALPEIVVTDVGAARVCVVHDLTGLDLDPGRQRIDVVISGHSHRPCVERRGRVLLLNPGSAGPRRFRLPVSVARLFVGPRAMRAHIVEIGVGREWAARPRNAGRAWAGTPRLQNDLTLRRDVRSIISNYLEYLLSLDYLTDLARRAILYQPVGT
jgi:uncharacterized protein